MKKRLLYISNLYPNAQNPNRAAFNYQQLESLRDYFEIDIIAPIPWTDLVTKCCKRSLGGTAANNIYHPVYWYPPGGLRTTYGICYYHSIHGLVRQLLLRNRYDLIYSSWLYPDGWAAVRLAMESELPVFVKVHGTDVNRLVAGSALTKKSLSVAHSACKVICVSQALRDRLLGLGCEPDKLVVVYNGVNRDIFRPRPRNAACRELGVDPALKLILFVGNLIKEKGLWELISAFRLLDAADTHLAIIGVGPYENVLRRLIAQLPHPEKVHLLGSQPLEQVALWMNAASVLCLPSYMEGVPNVVLEALASDTPVVSTSVGGLPELVNKSSSLFLIEPRTVNPLVEALRQNLIRGIRPVDSSFINSWQDVATQLTEIFACAQGIGR
jgi:glycosyltransferase involved in cell wall biosynthesis